MRAPGFEAVWPPTRILLEYIDGEMISHDNATEEVMAKALE